MAQDGLKGWVGATGFAGRYCTSPTVEVQCSAVAMRTREKSHPIRHRDKNTKFGCQRACSRPGTRAVDMSER